MSPSRLLFWDSGALTVEGFDWGRRVEEGTGLVEGLQP